MTRPYTGWNGDAAGKRAGLEKLVQLIVAHFDGGVWNNGTWAVRAMKNPNLDKPRPSVHGTGRAADISWRRRDNGKGFGRYEVALQVVEFLSRPDVADALLIEELHDYWPAPFGRGWRCDRGVWKVYDKPSIGSAPNGDWFHFEIAETHADDPAYYETVFAQIVSGSAPAASPAAAAPVAPAAAPAAQKASSTPFAGKSLKVGSSGAAVKQIQTALGLTADGKFGPQTDAAVKAFQTGHGLTADGVVGPKTWAVLFA